RTPRLPASPWSPRPALRLDGRLHLGPRVPSFDESKGRIVLLFFWAHWCADCKADSTTVVRVTRPLFIYSLGPLQIVLMCEASPVDGGALAALEHDLEEPYACMNEQRPTRHVRDLEHLVVRDARLHKARRDVDHEAEAREPAAALEPSTDVVGQGDALAGDAV